MRQDPSFPILVSSPARRRGGFTLVEMLVVVSIISLIVLIAVPSFRAMTGGRSVDAAANTLAAMVGRARTEAIGLQRTSGVLFFMDQGTDRVAAIVVREVTPPTNNNAPPDVVYLDMAPNGDFTLLPQGIGLNTVDDARTTGSPPVRQDDGYIGFNPVYLGPAFTDTINSGGIPSRCGGAILFDGAGRLAVRPYRLLLLESDGVTPNGRVATELAKALAYNRNYTLPANTNTMGKALKGKIGSAEIETVSSVGVVLFDLPSFREATGYTPNGSNTVTTFGGTSEGDGRDKLGEVASGSGYATSDDEKGEEAWLDQNATPFVVARHSGALMKNQ